MKPDDPVFPILLDGDNSVAAAGITKHELAKLLAMHALIAHEGRSADPEKLAMSAEAFAKATLQT